MSKLKVIIKYNYYSLVWCFLYFYTIEESLNERLIEHILCNDRQDWETKNFFKMSCVLYRVQNGNKHVHTYNVIIFTKNHCLYLLSYNWLMYKSCSTSVKHLLGTVKISIWHLLFNFHVTNHINISLKFVKIQLILTYMFAASMSYVAVH